jgi:hypothetical protein
MTDSRRSSPGFATGDPAISRRCHRSRPARQGSGGIHGAGRHPGPLAPGRLPRRAGIRRGWSLPQRGRRQPAPDRFHKRPPRQPSSEIDSRICHLRYAVQRELVLALGHHAVRRAGGCHAASLGVLAVCWRPTCGSDVVQLELDEVLRRMKLQICRAYGTGNCEGGELQICPAYGFGIWPEDLWPKGHGLVLIWRQASRKLNSS